MGGCCTKAFLTFGELARFTGFLQTIFTAFFHSRVTGHKTGFFKRWAQFGVCLNQSTGNAMTYSAGLTGAAAAHNSGGNIIFIKSGGKLQRLSNCLLYTS